jgi:RNA polymerase sigma factor (sigma-70 family)
MAEHRLRLVVGDDARRGADAISFDEFFEAESEQLFRRLWLVTRDRHEAEEVMQDAFLRLLERWDRIAEIRDPVAYLYRTAFNVWNKRARRATRALRAAVSADRRGDDEDAADARTLIGQALDRLTPRQRAAVVLTELLGFTSEEAGEVLGIRGVTARVLTSQARATMRAQLGAIDDG